MAVKDINLAPFESFQPSYPESILLPLVYPTIKSPKSLKCGVKGVKNVYFHWKISFDSKMKKRLEFVFTKHPRTSLINFINPKQFRKGWESRARTSDYINGLHPKFGNFCNFSCLGCLWRPVRCHTVRTYPVFWLICRRNRQTSLKRPILSEMCLSRWLRLSTMTEYFNDPENLLNFTMLNSSDKYHIHF